MELTKEKCYCCEHTVSGLNPNSSLYSGVEIDMLNEEHNHYLRCRANYGKVGVAIQDIIEINYCPICGRNLREMKE